MRLTDDDVAEFRALWREEFSEEISEEYARKRASELIELYLVLYGPRESTAESKMRPHRDETPTA